MAAPGPVLQLGLLVDYPMGFANPANTPTIWVFALVDPGDSVSAGIRLRIERCTGAGCSGFAFQSNVNGPFNNVSPDQASGTSVAAYDTTYRFRVRLENNDGNGPYSAEVEINTLIHGTAATDSGDITDFVDQVHNTGLRLTTESESGQVRNTGARELTEWQLGQLFHTGLRQQTEFLLGELRHTGLRIIVEWVETNAVDLRITKTSSNSTPTVGEQFIWTVLVENVSTNDASNVVVNDVLPGCVIYVSHVADVGTFDPISGIWNIGDLAAGESATLEVTVTAGIIVGPCVNIASVTSSEPDANPDDNTDDDTVVIQPPPPSTNPCPPENPPPIPPIPPEECPPRTPPDTLNYSIPFRLYQRDVEVRIKSWGDDLAYAIVRPYGGPSYEKGAEI